MTKIEITEEEWAVIMDALKFVARDYKLTERGNIARVERREMVNVCRDAMMFLGYHWGVALKQKKDSERVKLKVTPRPSPYLTGDS